MSGLVCCRRCGYHYDEDSIMNSGLCVNCDPENQANCKGDEINDREGDV